MDRLEVVDESVDQVYDARDIAGGLALHSAEAGLVVDAGDCCDQDCIDCD